MLEGTDTGSHQLPDQHVSTSKKIEEGHKWAKQTIDAYINKSNFVSSQEKLVIDKLYALYEGTMDPSDYTYITNPLNSKRKEFRNYPAKLRNYNIIRPVINLFLGEFLRRPNNFTVVCKNPDLEHKKKEELSKELKNNLVQQFMFRLQQLQQEKMAEQAAKQEQQRGGQVAPQEDPAAGQGQILDPSTMGPQEQPQDPQQMIKEKSQNYQDVRAEYGQAAINIMERDLHLEETFFHQFFEFIVTGYTASFKTVRFDEPYYEVVPYTQLDYEKDPDIRYIEDANWVVRRKRMSWQSIKAYFKNELKGKDGEKFIKAIETEKQYATADSFLDAGFTYAPDPNITDNDGGEHLMNVYHCVWIAGEKIKILKFRDQFGMPREIEVDETFNMSKQELRQNEMVLEEEWVNQLYEGYRIGDQHKKYLSMRPYPYPREDVNNTSVIKNPYNGVAYSDKATVSTSVPEMGYAYQILYNSLHYQFELALGRSKGKIILMEYNAIPKKHGWDEEKFMYYADAHNFAFVDTLNSEGGENLKHFNQYQVLDASLAQHIGSILNAMAAVKMEWEEVMGINRQRKGNVNSSDGKATTERAIFASSTISEEIFWKFDKYAEREMQGLLEISKYAWIDGKTVPFKSSDGREMFLEIEPEEFLSSDLNIYAVNSSEEYEKLLKMQELTLAFAQNGMNPSIIAEILDTKSFTKIKRLMTKVEETNKESQQAMAGAEEKSKQETLAIEASEAEKSRRQESTENQLDRIHEKDLKQMEMANSIIAKGLESDTTSQDDYQLQRDKNLQEKATKIAEMYMNSKLKNRELDIKEKEIKSKERIEKEKNKTALKNKVAGEK